MCNGCCKYAEGGEVKDKPMMQDKAPMQGPNLPGAQSAQASMRNAFGTPKKMSHGGMVKHSKDKDQKGVHKQLNTMHPGESLAGYHTEYHKRHEDDPDTGPYEKNSAYTQHEKVLSEMRSMPNPKLKGLSEGGKVYSIGPMKDERQPSKAALTAYDEGGSVEKEMDHDMDDSMDMEDIACDELVSALEKKDKQGIKESLKALIMSMKE